MKWLKVLMFPLAAKALGSTPGAAEVELVLEKELLGWVGQPLTWKLGLGFGVGLRLALIQNLRPHIFPALLAPRLNQAKTLKRTDLLSVFH